MTGSKYDPPLDEVRVDDTNFSYKDVECCIMIPETQQMIVHDELTINNTLILEGDLILET